MNYLLEALKKKLEGEIEVAKANVMVYRKNAAGIGEHPDVLDAINSQIVKIAAASENIQVLQKHFVDQKVI